jgi:iron complex outermembrane recepter protein
MRKEASRQRQHMSRYRHPILALCAALVLPATGMAQTAAREGSGAGAVAADAPAEGLISITVTARRREEKIQDVPAPLTALRGDELEAHKLYQVQDLQQVLPNVSAQFLHARQSSVAVRGIGNNTANDGLEGSVGIYLDNVFLGRPGQAVFDLLDIEQIDLMRGPQGTLFGKNTTAGVINISSRAPSFEDERSAELSFGQRRYRQVKGTISGPVSAALAYRVNVYQTGDDGWIDNLTDGRRLDSVGRKGVRAQLLFKPDAQWRARAIAEHHDEDSSTGTLVPYSYGPLNRGPGTNSPFGTAGGNATTFAAWAARLGARDVITDPYAYQVSLDGPQRESVDQNAASLQIDWKGGGYQLTSISAWRNWHFEPSNDIDGTSLPGFTNGGFKVKESQRSQEVRLASPPSTAYDYVLGMFYLGQQVGSDNVYSFGPAAAALTGNPNNSTLSGHGRADTRSIAAFGQGNVHLSPRADLTLGLRRTSEDKEGQVHQDQIRPALPPTVSPFFNDWDSGALNSKDSSLAYLVTASVHPDGNTLAYATVSRAEKSGGFNVNSVASVGAVLGADALRVAPERARNAEVGIKTSWLDHRIVFNSNAFITKVADYQAITVTQIGTAYIVVMSNVGDLTSKGIEFDFKAMPSRQLELGMNGAFTDARFDSGTAPTPVEVFNSASTPANAGYGKGFRSIAGNQVNGAPRWILNTNAQWRFKPRGDNHYYLNGNVSLRSDSYADVNNSVYSRLAGYGIVNLNAGLWRRSGEHRIDFSLWVKNVMDKRYFLGLTTFNNAYYGSAGQPRTMGMSMRYDF